MLLGVCNASLYVHSVNISFIIQNSIICCFCYFSGIYSIIICLAIFGEVSFLLAIHLWLDRGRDVEQWEKMPMKNSSDGEFDTIMSGMEGHIFKSVRWTTLSVFISFGISFWTRETLRWMTFFSENADSRNWWGKRHSLSKSFIF